MRPSSLMKRLTRSFVVSIGVSFFFFVLFSLGIFSSWQWKIADVFYTGYKAPSDIVILAIDNQSIKKISRWPWPRDIHAQIVNRLVALEPLAIGYDVNFPDAGNEAEDTALENALRNTSSLVLPFEALVNLRVQPPVATDTVVPLPRFANHATLGISNTPPDADGIFRRVPVEVILKNGDHAPSFFAAVLQKANVKITSLQNTLLIQFAGPARTFKTYPVADFLDGKIADTELQHKIILVGATAPDLHDDMQTPTAKSERMSGVEVHANAIASARMGGLREEASVFVLLTLLVLALFGALSFSLIRRVRNSVIIVFIIFVLYFLSALFVFDSGLILSMFYPLSALIVASIISALLRLIQEKREKGQLRSTLSRYLSPQVVQHLLDHPERLKLGGEKREMTVLFSDLRGFTSLSETLTPEQLVTVLNTYLSEMTAIVFEQGGVLDKYIGDAVMAFWNAPLDDAEHATHAVKTAVLMRDRLAEMNASNVFPNKIQLRVGVGVNTGQMVVGNMGGEERFDYTVMGDSVNLGSRLESLNKEYGSEIIVAASTVKLLQDDFLMRSIDLVAVKGKKEPVEIFEVLGFRHACSADMIRDVRLFEEARHFYIAQKFAEAKHLFDEIVAANSNDTGAKMYSVRCEAFLAHSPPSDWNGVWVMTKK